MKLIRVVVGLLCLAIGASGLALGVGALVAGDHPKWPLFGMEIVSVVAGAIGVFLALGKMRGAPSLALACVAGSIFVAAVLGYYGASGRLELQGGKPPISLKPILMARLASVGLMALMATYTNLRRDSLAAKMFAKGVLWSLPIVLMGGAYMLLRGMLSGLAEGVVFAIAGVAGLVVLISLSGVGHCLIRAFEIGAKTADPIAGGDSV